MALSTTWQMANHLLEMCHDRFLIHPVQYITVVFGRAEMESDGTRKRTGGVVKGKKANGGGSQHSRALYGTRSIQHYYR